MARTIQKQIIKMQLATFADWCAEVRELAGEHWPEVSDQAPTGAAARRRNKPCTWSS